MKHELWVSDTSEPPFSPGSAPVRGASQLSDTEHPTQLIERHSHSSDPTTSSYTLMSDSSFFHITLKKPKPKSIKNKNFCVNPFPAAVEPACRVQGPEALCTLAELLQPGFCIPGHRNFQPFFPFLCAEVPCVCPQLRGKPRQAESLNKLPPGQAEIIQTGKKTSCMHDGRRLPGLTHFTPRLCVCDPCSSQQLLGHSKATCAECLALLGGTPSSPVYQTPQHTQRKS